MSAWRGFSSIAGSPSGRKLLQHGADLAATDHVCLQPPQQHAEHQPRLVKRQLRSDTAVRSEAEREVGERVAGGHLKRRHVTGRQLKQTITEEGAATAGSSCEMSQQRNGLFVRSDPGDLGTLYAESRHQALLIEEEDIDVIFRARGGK